MPALSPLQALKLSKSDGTGSLAAGRQAVADLHAKVSAELARMANLNSKVYYESVPALGALPSIEARVMAKPVERPMETVLAEVAPEPLS